MSKGKRVVPGIERAPPVHRDIARSDVDRHEHADEGAEDQERRRCRVKPQGYSGPAEERSRHCFAQGGDVPRDRRNDDGRAGDCQKRGKPAGDRQRSAELNHTRRQQRKPGRLRSLRLLAPSEGVGKMPRPHENRGADETEPGHVNRIPRRIRQNGVETQSQKQHCGPSELNAQCYPVPRGAGSRRRLHGSMVMKGSGLSSVHSPWARGFSSGGAFWAELSRAVSSPEGNPCFQWRAGRVLARRMEHAAPSPILIGEHPLGW